MQKLLIYLTDMLILKISRVLIHLETCQCCMEIIEKSTIVDFFEVFENAKRRVGDRFNI